MLTEPWLVSKINVTGVWNPSDDAGVRESTDRIITDKQN